MAAENVQQAVECVQSQLIGISQSGIADGSVSSEKLADNAVTLPKLAPGSVGEAQLIPGAVTAEKLSPASVGAEALAPEAVSSAALGPLCVTEEKLAPYSVSAVKLCPGTVNAVHLAPYSVTAEKLGTDCVTGGNEIEEGGEIVTLHGKLSSACVTKRNIRPGAVGVEETDGSLQPRHRLMTLKLDFAGESSVSVSAPGLPADADIIVSSDPLSYTEWAECLVRCSAQWEGSLSFTAETPPGAPIGARVLVLE